MPWLAGATLLGFGLEFYLALWASPADYQQVETVRIMYVHVPSAATLAGHGGLGTALLLPGDLHAYEGDDAGSAAANLVHRRAPSGVRAAPRRAA